MTKKKKQVAKKVVKKVIAKKKGTPPGKKRNFKTFRAKSTDGMESWKKGQLAMNKAAKGNQWYLLRSKHGRDKIFETPEIMWQAACEYFLAVDDNPLIEHKPFVTSDGGFEGSSVKLEEIPHKRPYTMKGLAIFCDVSEYFFKDFKLRSKDREDFLAVIQKIEDIVYSQKFDGASAGFFNANIISRDLGLIDKVESTNIEKKSVADVFPDELKDE